ncbi:MAG: D-alanyl-D-alanine carboxypeptidase [Actinomycetota bacterium]|nr:D-alanyl-D-alanine carboxypeptidase [Actinomycetota bacterium]
MAEAHEEASEDVTRVVVGAVVVIVAAVVGVQWFRSVPSPTYAPSLATVRVAGQRPALPWPQTGEAALAVDGVGSFGSVGSTQALPIASITKVMTAYVVLHDHPLATGASGPDLTVSALDVYDYRLSLSQKQSVVAVKAGEQVSERQALEAMLVPSGNNFARMLAAWDAGSISAFVAKMNADARALGLSSTHFAGPSGFSSASVSNAADLVKLGEAAMRIPAFAHIVAMPQVTLPVAGLLYNYDAVLGQDGIVGIKTGTNATSGGCFLFAADPTVGGRTVHLVGAVLGQGGVSPITTALDAGRALAKAASADLRQDTVVADGTVVGHVTTAWNSSVAAVAGGTVRMVGWPGLPVHVVEHVSVPSGPVRSGERIGSLVVEHGGTTTSVPVQAAGDLAGPSVSWKLTRL